MDLSREISSVITLGISVKFQKSHSIVLIFKERKLNKWNKQGDPVSCIMVNMTPGSTVQKVVHGQVAGKSIIGTRFYCYQRCHGES